MGDSNKLSWPATRLGEALEALARHNGLSSTHPEIANPPQGLARESSEMLGRWIDTTAAWLGLEAEAVETPYGEVGQLVCRAGPAILRLPGKGEARFLVLLGGRRTVLVLGTDLSVHRVPAEVIRATLCQELEAPLRAEVDRLLDEAGVPARRRPSVNAAILQERLSGQRIGDCWLLRPRPGSSFWRQAWHARLPGRLLTLLGAHTVQYLLWLTAWWMIGRAALQGRLDQGWLLAWALLLLTLIPFRLLTTWSQGRLAIGVGSLLKQRLLYGALRLDPEEIRHMGAGQLLGRVLESEAVESLALSGGLLGLVAGIELIFSAGILGMGPGGALSLLLLFGWMGFTVLIGWRYFWRRRRWTAARLALTHDLVERMVGHRTRIAQEPRESWHAGEDQALERYLELSAAMDRTAQHLLVLVPRGWLVLGLAALAPAFIAARSAPLTLALSLGGIVLAYRALQKLGAGLSHLAGAVIAWKQVAFFFHAASRKEWPSSPALIQATGSDEGGAEERSSVVEASAVVFRYRPQGDPVLRGCNFQIQAGNRVLLEGPSGGGKSTLTALLIGLRPPESGLLLLGGMDRQTLGSEGWRRRIVAAPQFHENHVLTGTFAFNLLMGRRWPPRAEDLVEAEAICRELGLDDLLKRMPAGLMQMVGETGWQLSHGERSRLFIARALIQGAELVILDESFAALDPENLSQALRCVLDRAPTLLVVAHP